ncbi:hypothetical protein [Zhihengliuella flava]|uniref:Uncharacterized protein n=1 Tax=Zhihengliuella flava TaxID=1285193 RepID=A0A931DAQ1_9MICC|nr:hypothetical protein [Zhihengliuella flava]MBG6083235.1 hypothetical protein [Zhihengliuella flava]
MDLAEWYAAGRWVGLLDLIDMLPAACRLNEAIANDPEAAEAIAAMPQLEEEWAPRTSEFDLHAKILREIVHELKQNRQATIAAAGGKPPAESPFPAPRTEIDKAIERAERTWTQDFIQQFGFDATDI